MGAAFRPPLPPPGPPLPKQRTGTRQSPPSCPQKSINQSESILLQKKMPIFDSFHRPPLGTKCRGQLFSRKQHTDQCLCLIGRCLPLEPGRHHEYRVGPPYWSALGEAEGSLRCFPPLFHYLYLRYHLFNPSHCAGETRPLAPLNTPCSVSLLSMAHHRHLCHLVLFRQGLPQPGRISQ